MSSQQNDPFYITTPIYYINGAPHIGHAYTTVTCDALARAMRMRGRDVRFLTGTDEHGLKAQKSAEAQGLEPRELADRMVARYREAWKTLEISNDDFIRTTEPRHVKGAQELWRRMEAAGDLYKGNYSGMYCVACEAYYPESQLDAGRCPEHGTPTERIEEESWFFRLSKYQQPLLDFYRSHPDFVKPQTRMNEVVSFVEMGLEDLSVSRKISWGIPVPGDPDHVMYVWVDALSNYITSLGFGDEDSGAFDRFWPADVQMIAKDILRFHAVYWPAFLMSAGVPPPKQILCHGWWLKDDAKMSKTTGNVADPMELVQWFGADAVRYFLLREVSIGNDGNYSEEAMVDRINSDLANDLGNTLSRVTKLVSDQLGGRVPPPWRGGLLRSEAESAWGKWIEAIDASDVQAALRATWELLSATNRFLVAEAPWKKAEDDGQRARLEEVLHDAAEALRHVAVMVAPAMPGAAREMWRRLGAAGDPFTGLLMSESGAVDWGFPSTAPVVHDTGIFPRMDKATFFAGVRRDDEGRTTAGRSKEAAARTDARVGAAAVGAGDTRASVPGVIHYDDFARVELTAARVLSCKAHPNADKLLVLELEDGGEHPRTICAGIAAFYKPEDLVGKTLAIVANLAPRKLRGVESQGMVLAASWTTEGKEGVRVVELHPDVPPGAEVR